MLFNKNIKKELAFVNEGGSTWLETDAIETEGQLSIDVYQTNKEIVIKSTIAGVKPEDLKISLHNDLLNIKGFRQEDKNIKDENYLYRECYWGSFSRSIILPFEVDGKDIKAEIENGLLTIRLKKAESKKIEVVLKD